MRAFAGIPAALMAVSGLASAQTTPARPSFEVASSKVNTIDGPSDRVPIRSGDRVTMRNVTPDWIVRYAYSTTGVGQLVGNLTLPGSEASQWFDIVAIAPGSPSLRNQGSCGIRSGDHEGQAEAGGIEPEQKRGVDIAFAWSAWITRKGSRMRFPGRAATIAEIAGLIGSAMHAPVRDETGIKGMQAGGAPFLTTAIQDELGLRLEKNKTTLRVLVIDHVERPAAN